MEQTDRIPTGVAHGRFQPPHKGHVRYLLAALMRAEQLYIGIATPILCTEEEAARTGYPCTAALNPFSYDERKGMIEAALDEAGISRERYTCLPFPSDYASVEKLFPSDAVFLMSVTGASDSKKIAHIESLGYRTETVLEIPESDEREHAGGVRENARDGGSGWHELVPLSVRAYMESHNLVEKLGKGTELT
jgi:nicotinamide mononucleotide adenylyltransferase